MKTKSYIFRYDQKGHLCADTTRTQIIELFIGQYLTSAFQAVEQPNRGLQLVRFKIGSSTIVARRRLNDVKITIYEDLK